MSIRHALFAASAAGVVASATLAGPGGFLVVPDWTADRVVALNPFDGSVINANLISGAGTLLSPKSAVDSGRGTIFVSDQLADTITEWRLDGGFVGTVVQGGAAGQIDNLRGMTVRDNFMYVTVGSGTFAGSVQRFDLNGGSQSTFATTGGSPFDIFFYNDEALVSNSTTNLVDRFDMSGNLLGSFNAPGMSFPQQIQERANGNLIVATFSGAGASGIYEFDSNYTLLNSFQLGLGLRGVYELGNGNLLFTNGSAIFTLDTATGQTTQVLSGGNFQYIHLVIPAPGAAGVLALGGLAAARRRRR